MTSSPIHSRGTVTRADVEALAVVGTARRRPHWDFWACHYGPPLEVEGYETDGLVRLSEVLALFPVEAGDVGGWRMVPVEPTEAMLENAIGTLTVLGNRGQTKVLARQFYRAMLAASPPLAEGQDHE